MIGLHDLDVVAAVVATGSFVRAGQRVGLTQSGVSRAVARVEQRLAVRLFERTARAVTLTDDGRRFYAEITPVLQQLREAVDGARGAAAAVVGRLRVNVDPFFSAYVLAPRLGEFLAQHPKLDVELVVSEHVGSLVAGGFDAAVRFGEPVGRGVIARRLLETRIVTCAAPSYLARRGTPRAPRDLAHHACILYIDPATGRPFDWEFRRGKQRVVVPVRGQVTVNALATGVGLCVAGAGVAQLMELGNQDRLARGELVALVPRWQDERFPLYLLLPSRQQVPAKVRAFVDFVVATTAISASRRT